MWDKILKQLPKIWALIRPWVGKALGAVTAYFTVKDIVLTLSEKAGKAAVERMALSPYFIVMVTCILFVFMASYLPSKKLLDKRVSWVIVGLFFVALGSSKSVVKHFKEQVYTPQFISAKSYEKGERTLKQVYRDNNVKSDTQKRAFATSLLKAETPEERALFRDVIKDGTGWFTTIFDKKEMTFNCIVYGDIGTFDFLQKMGLIDVEASLKYDRFNAAATVSGKKEFTPLEVARMEAKNGIEKKIMALIPTLKDRSFSDKILDSLYRI